MGWGTFAVGRLLGSTSFARTPGGADGAGSRGAIAETSTAGEKASGRLPLLRRGRRLFASAEFSVSGVGRPVHEGLSPPAHAYYLLTNTYLGHISRGPRTDTTSFARLHFQTASFITRKLATTSAIPRSYFF